MFFHILLLYFTLSCISFSSLAFSPSPHSPGIFFVSFIALGAFLFLQKVLLKPYFSSTFLKTLFHLQLTAFILLYYFFFELQDSLFPYLSHTQSLGLYSLFLSLPYLALNLFIQAILKKSPLKNASQELFENVRFLSPFFFIHTSLLFVLDFIQTPAILIPLFCLSILLIPYVIAGCWSNKGLGSLKLETELQQLCQRMNFSYKALRTWQLFPQSPNAAILGFFFFNRFVLFSPCLLQQFSLDEIKAILVHEIGHQKKQHLLFYPLTLIVGFFVSAYLHHHFITPLYDFSALFAFDKQISYSPALKNLSVLCLHFLFFSLYFRFIFGYVSRNFERQADSTLISSPIAVTSFQNALKKSADLNGQSPKKNCWHHFGIQERIDYLSKALPSNLAFHEKKIIAIKSFIICAFCLFLWLPFEKQTPLTEPLLAKPLETYKSYIASKKVPKFLAPHPSIISALKSAMDRYGALELGGMFEYYSGHYLYAAKQEAAAFYMLKKSWDKIDPRIFKNQGFAEYQKKMLMLLTQAKISPETEALIQSIEKGKPSPTIIEKEK